MKKLLLIAILIYSGTLFAQQMDYSKWDTFLKKYVTAGKVKYADIKKDTKTLEDILKLFSQNIPNKTWNKNQKLAYWMNAYNAYTIQLVVNNYPTKSITKIEKGKPWDKKFIPNGKSKISLNYIEHEILRKMNEPRIHFGIICASISCPNIPNKAFTPENVNKLMDNLAKRFINDPSKNKITAKKIQISEIFNWFGSDFKTKNTTLIDFLNKYSSTQIIAKAKVTFLPYNWGLNE